MRDDPLMIRSRSRSCALLASGFLLAVSGSAQQPPQTAQGSKTAMPPSKFAATSVEPALEPKAIEILKAMSSRLAAARSMTFMAVTTYESPSVYGPALAYTTTSEVTLQRPNKVKVITKADGPASEIYYDGKTIMAYAPAEDLVAVANAPPTIDAMLKALYDTAGTYLPFTDFIVADPYGDMAPGLKFAFYIGQSKVVGATTTEMVAYEAHGVFVQIWIGAEDKLPRMARAVFFDDPLQLRHQVELSHWQLDPGVAPESFASSKTATAKHIQFAHPKSQSKLPPGPKPQPTPKSQ
jgi:hypothetical protein